MIDTRMGMSKYLNVCVWLIIPIIKLLYKECLYFFRLPRIKKKFFFFLKQKWCSNCISDINHNMCLSKYNIR